MRQLLHYINFNEVFNDNYLFVDICCCNPFTFWSLQYTSEEVSILRYGQILHLNVTVIQRNPMIVMYLCLLRLSKNLNYIGCARVVL